MAANYAQILSTATSVASDGGPIAAAAAEAAAGGTGTAVAAAAAGAASDGVGAVVVLFISFAMAALAELTNTDKGDPGTQVINTLVDTLVDAKNNTLTTYWANATQTLAPDWNDVYRYLR